METEPLLAPADLATFEANASSVAELLKALGNRVGVPMARCSANSRVLLERKVNCIARWGEWVVNWL
ncbi:hypothetical protein, partial [uncultured Marinobacter sp.]|uniref:hypothetical protein n=1 Tax=uncultured Marinobacter sp. TaxID=187379 RepID=UPI00258BD36E